MRKASHFRWRRGPTILGLAVFSLVVVGGTTALHARGLGVTEHMRLTYGSVLVLASVCMITERGSWRLWKRIAFVPLAWAIYAFVCAPVALLSVMFVVPDYPQLLCLVVISAASLPLAAWVMRHSWLFVLRMSVRGEDETLSVGGPAADG